MWVWELTNLDGWLVGYDHEVGKDDEVGLLVKLRFD